jgi:hypothetical protein
VKRLVLLGTVGLVIASAAACKGKAADQHASAPATGSAAQPTPPAAPPPAPLPASYAALVGDKPATLGPALAGLAFGAAVDPEKLAKTPGVSFGFLGEVPPGRMPPSTDAGPKALVNLEIRAGTLFAYRIELLTEKGSIPEDSCAGIAKALDAKWGAAADHIWTDKAAHVRAALVDTCILVFERYADPPAWFGTEPTAIVPVASVGKPAKELASRVGPDVKLDEDVTFRAPGVGEHAVGATAIDAYLKKGTVSGLGIDVAAAAADRAAIRDRISAVVGSKPTRDNVTGYDVWTGGVPVRMLETQNGVRVEVGKLAQ